MHHSESWANNTFCTVKGALARSKQDADDDPFELRLTIRGGDLQSRTPRARSESGVDSSASEEAAFAEATRLRGIFAGAGSGGLSVPKQLQMRLVLRFRINYSTRWGENMMILGSTEELGGLGSLTEADARKAITANKGKVMRYISDGNWEFVSVLDSPPTEMHYRYVLIRERGEPLIEGGPRNGRMLDLEGVTRRWVKGMSPGSVQLASFQMEVRDQWRVSRANGEDVVLRSDALTKVIYAASRSFTDANSCRAGAGGGCASGLSSSRSGS
eukprot:CAMPEP_0113674680 /NCGR_PEP_ID=MMETSP0038_2-20120614/7565_1 /TAXON_ID=2898 /ORGANISM="Cryptomonas paramecium" /LENGTH=271 /DNA_ID=CAMNT_0000591311 /DNA_START=420 /DNA_END=1233 /DNA_ORIENTATION=+ /assembly_acc=CAM_ASM_000170